jgi:ADP-ribose pyrophosphatase YjhB (NUDIX family)
MGQMHKHPTSFQATDAVIIHREAGRLLLGRKKKEPLWRFIGGFVSPQDQSLEQACIREIKEEAASDGNMCFDYPVHLHSFRVPDPRYASGPDAIMSATFRVWYLHGAPKAGDDIRWVKWFTRDYLRRNFTKIVMPEHQMICYKLIEEGLL